jgi:hypothetical protein
MKRDEFVDFCGKVIAVRLVDCLKPYWLAACLLLKH